MNLAPNDNDCILEQGLSIYQYMQSQKFKIKKVRFHNIDGIQRVQANANAEDQSQGVMRRAKEGIVGRTHSLRQWLLIQNLNIMEKLGAEALGEVLQTVVSKEERAGGRKWLQVINMSIATLSVIFLSITNSTEMASNIIFFNIIKAHTYLNSQSNLSVTLVWVFFAMTLKSALLASMLFAARILQDKHSQAWQQGRKRLRKYTAFWLVVFKFFLVPMAVACFKLGGSKFYVLYIITFILAMFIIYTFRLKLLYGCYFTLVIAAAWIAPTSNFPLCLLVLSVLLLLKCQAYMRNYLVLISVYQILIFSNNALDTEISSLHLVVITVAVLASSLLVPIDPLLTQGAETILKAMEKLHKGQIFCKDQEWELCRLGCHVAQQSKRQGIPLDPTKSAAIQSLQVSATKEGLCNLLKSWLYLKKATSPSDLLLDIQLAQGQLFFGNFSVSSLTQIETIGRNVEQKGSFDDRLRMMKLRHRLQKELMRRDEKLCKLRSIVQVEKYKQTLRQKTSELLNLYIAFWQSPSRTEEELMNKLSTICDIQQGCLNILEKLRKNGHACTQARFFNLIQKGFNNFSHDYAQQRKKTEVKQDNGDTSYIMVSGSVITDISERLTSQIQGDKNFILGSDVLSIIPVELQPYYLSHINQWLVSSHPIYLPLASSHDENVFFPSQCLFKILPQIEGGVRYLINVWSSALHQGEAFLLYSINNDRITKATSDFRQDWLKGTGGFSAQEVLGIDLTFLSNYIRPEQAIQPIICELTLNSAVKKSRTRKISKHSQHVLRLVEVYETRNDKFCLLSVANRYEEKVKGTDATLAHLQQVRNEQVRNDPNFCPIKNPHEQLLEQRLNQHQYVVFRRTYLRTIMVFFFVGLIVGLGAFIQFQAVINSSISTLSDQVASYTSHLNMQESIYVLFYNVYIYIHSIKRPQDFILSQPAISISKLQAGYKSKVIKSLSSALNMTLDPQIIFIPAPYQFVYPDYVVTSTTDPTTLIPLLEGIRSSLTTLDFTFVIRNANVVDTFINSMLPIDTNILHKAQEYEYFCFLAAIAGLIACFLLVKCQYMRIRMTIWDVLELYGKLSKEQVRNHLSFLMKVKKAEKNFQIDDDSESLYESRNSGGSQLVEPAKKSTFFKGLIRQNLLLIVTIGAWSVLFYYCYSRLDAYRAETKMIIDYASKIQTMSKTMTARSQFYYRLAMQELLPKEQRYQWPSQTSISIPSLFPDAASLPPNFDDFAAIQGKYLQQSLCELPNVQSSIQKDLFMSTLNCSKILKNVLTDGFETAFPYYLHTLGNNMGTLLGGLGSARDNDAQYPFFAEVIYTRRALDSVVGRVKSGFSSQIGEFMDAKELEFNQLIGLGVLIGLVAIGTALAFLFRTRRLCMAGRKAFSVLPKSLIYNIRVSKYLLNSALLSEIERLAP